MGAIDALNKAREALRKQEEAPEEESREIVLSPEEVLLMGRSGFQEGSPVSVVINGTLSGGVITVASIDPKTPMQAQTPDKAPIVRINPAPYAG